MNCVECPRPVSTSAWALTNWVRIVVTFSTSFRVQSARFPATGLFFRPAKQKSSQYSASSVADFPAGQKTRRNQQKQARTQKLCIISAFWQKAAEIRRYPSTKLVYCKSFHYSTKNNMAPPGLPFEILVSLASWSRISGCERLASPFFMYSTLTPR